jgi:PAS domain S-box-containing protein
MRGYIAQRTADTPRRVAVMRYAGALLSVVIAVFLALWLQPVLDAAVVLLMAVVVAAWFSGLWPALAASLLATLTLDYFFTQPLHTFRFDLIHIPRLAVFTLVTALFTSVSARRRSAERSLKQARDELDTRVQQRTAELQTAHAGAVALQQRYRDLVNSIDGIVWEADAQTFQFTFVSEQAQRVLGYPVEQWVSQPTFWKEHIFADDREWAVNYRISATAQKKDHDVEYRVVAPDGRVVWVRDLVSVVVEHDEATRLRGVMLDITTRKQNEQVLREQADLLNLTHDTIFVRDLNDVIRYWNRGAEERYGWTRDEAVGHVSHDLMQTIFPAPIETINAELLGRGRWEGELRHTKRDGSHVVVASRWSLQRDPDGRPIAILETNNDITGRKRAEDALRASEEQWKAVFENNPTMYFMVDPAGTVLSVNPFGADQLGYTVEDLIGQPVLKVFQEKDWDTVRQSIEACLRDIGQVRTWEIQKIRRDGTVIWVRETAKAMQRTDGGHVVLIACEDITLRKRAEADLGESERRHRHIFHATGTSIWEEDFSAVKAAIEDLKRSGVSDLREYLTSSPDFIDRAISLVRIVDVNDATLKLFGAASKHELLVSLHKVFTPETREVFAGELIAIAEGQTSFEGETVLQRLNGERIVALFSVSFPPADAAFDAVLVSIMDITDRKRAEQELEELAGRLINAQEEERSRIGRELHDHISQTLGVLTIRIDQLRDDDATPPAMAAALEELRQSTTEITNDIHSLSHRLHSSALDYLGLVPALQRLVKEFSTRHGITIDLAHSAIPAALPSDVALSLFRVTEEGLTNIAKHSQAQSARVHVNGEPDGLHLTIEDAGTGFAMDTLEGRSGLGFVSMRERLRALRGTVRVYSAPSRGTRIEVWVPASSLRGEASGDGENDLVRDRPAIGRASTKMGSA